MRRVKADLNELCDASAVNNEEIEHYLDVETGKVIVWMDPIATGIRDQELAEEIEEGFGERYFRIPKMESHDAYRLMVEFAEAMEASSLRNRLLRALNWRKPFRAFKDVLDDFPAEREQWFKFERDAHRQEVMQWLELNQFSPDPL